jgi:hypothetical protein
MENSHRSWELERKQRFAEENVNNLWEDVIFADIGDVGCSGLERQHFG